MRKREQKKRLINVINEITFINRLINVISFKLAQAFIHPGNK